MQSTYIKSGDIWIHCLDSGGDLEPLILCHGLTANAWSFSGYISAGLTEHFRVIAIDLRGRGLSDKPDDAYTMDDHMADLLAILNHFGWEKAIIGGHSFGALLTIYSSYFHPEVFKAMILIDAAARLHPEARQMVAPSMSRLGKMWPSKEDFLMEMQTVDFLEGQWSEDLENYFLADIKTLPDGQVTTQSDIRHISQAIDKSLSLGEKWLTYITGAQVPALLINSVGEYQQGAALLPEELARETASIMHDCKYVQVSGNHLTMMFGAGAQQSVNSIIDFASHLA